MAKGKTAKSSSFASCGKIKIHYFTWADQDWIGLTILKNFANQDWIGFNFSGSRLDSDWKVSQSAHLWSGVPKSVPAGFCVFLSDQDPESTIWEKMDPDPKLLFDFSSTRSLCSYFSNKNMGKLWLDQWLQPESEQESDSQIWKIDGPGFKNFGTGVESETEKVTLGTSGFWQRWYRIRSAGVDSSRILRFSFGPGPDVKNLWKNGPRYGLTFPYRQYHESVCSFLR